MMMLSCHYRSPLNYSYDIIEQSKAALKRLSTCRENLEFVLGSAQGDLKDGEQEWLDKFAAHRARFIEIMDDDFNTAGGVSAIFDLARDVNTACAATAAPSAALCKAALESFDELTGVLGLLYEQGGEKNLDAEIEALIEQRQAARKAKNFAEADRIRDELKEQGIILEDTPQGVKWHRA